MRRGRRNRGLRRRGIGENWYSLGRFTSHGGIVSGLTGGGNYVITSVFSYGTVGLLAIRSPMMLGVAYLLLALLSGLAFGLFQWARVGARVGVEAPREQVTEESMANVVMEEAAA